MVDCEMGRVAVVAVLLLAASAVRADYALVSIKQLTVPALAALGEGPIELECEYIVADTAGLVVEWLFRPAGAEAEVVYRHEPPRPPEVLGALVGRADTSDAAAEQPLISRLRLLRPSVQLSGEYTCAVSTALLSMRRTRSMLVYSKETDFRLEARQQQDEVEVACSVNGVYPDPDLRLEWQGSPMTQQHQRVMKSAVSSDDSEGLLDARTTARLPVRHLRADETFVCRLALTQVPYEAFKELKFRPQFSDKIKFQHGPNHAAPPPTWPGPAQIPNLDDTPTTTQAPKAGGGGARSRAAALLLLVPALLLTFAH